jgi:hypothetical protein
MTPKWLSRVAFSFFIVGTFLAWEGYQCATGTRGPVGAGRIVLYLFAAMLCYVLGVTGLRQRHRPQDPPE